MNWLIDEDRQPEVGGGDLTTGLRRLAGAVGGVLGAEDAQVVGLVGESRGRCRGVVVRDADEDDEPGTVEGPDHLPVDGDMGTPRSLDDCSHGGQRAIIRR